MYCVQFMVIILQTCCIQALDVVVKSSSYGCIDGSCVDVLYAKSHQSGRIIQACNSFWQHIQPWSGSGSYNERDNVDVIFILVVHVTQQQYSHIFYNSHCFQNVHNFSYLFIVYTIVSEIQANIPSSSKLTNKTYFFHSQYDHCFTYLSTVYATNSNRDKSRNSLKLQS